MIASKWYWILLGFPVALVIACGSDDSTPIDAPSGGLPFETLTPPPSPTPLAEIDCPVALPSVSLHSESSVQTAVVLGTEWVGEDCSFIGQEFFYVPGEALQVTTGMPPTLVLSEEPVSLSATAWIPDLSAATHIESGELAVPMTSGNQGRRSIASLLQIDATSEQTLLIADLEPGEYVIQLISTWTGGLATLSLRIVIT
ncbi:MAG: hypothetical protein IH957_05970 [Chloroflexi bacterium]|nr:hypothetical protein [Chloroflexota bacterium]